MIFANPAGLWALLGIPAILLIHFLQRESKRVSVSTLFLLQALDRESLKGRRFDRLRNSVPLWLQLLGVLLLTWLLADPRWTSSRSVQRVVLVLDDSASMDAFREELKEALARELPPLSRFVGTTEYTAIESSSGGSTLYRGTSLSALLDSLEGWRPTRGTHSPAQALRVGRGLAGAEGVLLFVSDHPGEGAAPFGAVRLAVGRPIANVGFAGLRIERDGDRKLWRASIRNYSDRAQRRSWVLSTDAGRTEARHLDLEAGATLTLRGEFPPGADRASLLLEPDEFALDDRLFLVVPRPKRLLVAPYGDTGLAPHFARLLASLENAAEASGEEEADLSLVGYNPLAPSALPESAIVFLNQALVPRRFFSGPIVAANHELIRELDWQGLIARHTPSIPMEAGDEALLWQGDRTLVFLRGSEGRRRLVFNFDLVTSNAPRLPAWVVMVHRFADLVRSEKPGLEVRHVEWHQPLPLAFATGADAPPLDLLSESDGATLPSSLPLDRASHLRAPARPGYFRVAQGGLPLLEAAVNFADTREADFSKAGALSESAPLPSTLRERQTHADPLWFVWLLLFTAALLVAWRWLGKQDARPIETDLLKKELNS